jgi:thiol-disulfide isomerase/thioredoxin
MMRLNFQYFSLLFTLFVFGCREHHPSQEIRNAVQIESGSWRFVMDLGGALLPFNAEITTENSEPSFVIINGDERINLEQVEFGNDSIRAVFPVFQSEIQLRVDAPGLVSGKWIDHSKENYVIPLSGEYNKNFRFTPSKSTLEISDRYRVKFDYKSENPWDAILKIQNNEGSIEGTFLTETGDYRFLDGNIMNNKVYLSTFDGSHAFYFEASIKEDSLINGIFRSGTHYQTIWKGESNNDYQLTAPDQLTYLNEGYEFFDFQLPNQDGDTVSWSNLDLDGKVVIVDIMGSWCPNCLDANKSLQKLRSGYEKDELEILTIAFERTGNLKEARERIFKMQDQLGAERGFLFGGKASKKSASQSFPMLNHIMSYPTLIFIDKNRQVRHIYTGFYGPGTGDHYSNFMSETDSIIKALISEPA